MAVPGRISGAPGGPAELLAEEFSLRRPHPVLAHAYATRSHTLVQKPISTRDPSGQKSGHGGSSCAKTVPECHLFELLGLALSEKQVPQVSENTEKAKC
jgi:hypothetical protein